MIDAGEHLGLIHHMVNAVGVPSHLHDEAFSEGLVLLAYAAVSYDEEHGVPEGAYLAQRLRWGLTSWMRREIRHVTSKLDDRHPYSHEAEIEARRALDRLIFVAARTLNAPEYVALLGLVYGVRQEELAAILQKNATQLEALRLSARAKLRHELRVL